jgi:hypothetical protein
MLVLAKRRNFYDGGLGSLLTGIGWKQWFERFAEFGSAQFNKRPKLRTEIGLTERSIQPVQLTSGDVQSKSQDRGMIAGRNGILPRLLLLDGSGQLFLS